MFQNQSSCLCDRSQGSWCTETGTGDLPGRSGEVRLGQAAKGPEDHDEYRGWICSMDLCFPKQSQKHMYNRRPLTKGRSRNTRLSIIKPISSLDSRDQQSNVHHISKGGERMQHFPNFSGRKLLSGAPEQQGPRWGGGEEARQSVEALWRGRGRGRGGDRSAGKVAEKTGLSGETLGLGGGAGRRRATLFN